MTVGHDTVGGYVTLSVRLLREGYGYSDAAARSQVAKIFAKSGWLGRKGDALSASTLQDWQDRYAGLPTDHPVREGIERLWDEWTGGPNWLSGRDISAAISWVEKIAASPELRNKMRIRLDEAEYRRFLIKPSRHTTSLLQALS